LFGLSRADSALAHDNSRVAVQPQAQIIDFEFGETISPVMLFTSAPPARPLNACMMLDRLPDKIASQTSEFS
jgi:hypothetical protein